MNTKKSWNPSQCKPGSAGCIQQPIYTSGKSFPKFNPREEKAMWKQCCGGDCTALVPTIPEWLFPSWPRATVVLTALEKTLKAKSGLKHCGNESLEAVGWLWETWWQKSVCALQSGSDPQDSGFSTGWKGRLRGGGTGAPEPTGTEITWRLLRFLQFPVCSLCWVWHSVSPSHKGWDPQPGPPFDP